MKLYTNNQLLPAISFAFFKNVCDKIIVAEIRQLLSQKKKFFNHYARTFRKIVKIVFSSCNYLFLCSYHDGIICAEFQAFFIHKSNNVSLYKDYIQRCMLIFNFNILFCTTLFLWWVVGHQYGSTRCIKGTRFNYCYWLNILFICSIFCSL